MLADNFKITLYFCYYYYHLNLQYLFINILNRVATQPGKSGEPGKVREFDI